MVEKISYSFPNGKSRKLAKTLSVKLLKISDDFQVQFVAIFTHQFQLLFRECDYPKGFMVWIGLHGVMFLFLFSDFYKQAYQKRAAAAQKKFDDYQNGVKANGHANGKINGTNEGACMVSTAITTKKNLKFFAPLETIFCTSQTINKFIDVTKKLLRRN